MTDFTLAAVRPLTDLEKQGLIQAFEFTHELAWNTMKDFYEFQGESGIQGSRCGAARLPAGIDHLRRSLDGHDRKQKPFIPFL